MLYSVMETHSCWIRRYYLQKVKKDPLTDEELEFLAKCKVGDSIWEQMDAEQKGEVVDVVADELTKKVELF